MTDSADHHNFKMAMRGVRPLRRVHRCQLDSKEFFTTTAFSTRRADAVVERPMTSFPMLDAAAHLKWKIAGVHYHQLHQLSCGNWYTPCTAKLDLHGCNVCRAEERLRRFIRQVCQFRENHALIVHGKGKNSINGQAVIKSYVASWLPTIPTVAAFCSAQPCHGGSGAVYVLLRKSENN